MTFFRDRNPIRPAVRCVCLITALLLLFSGTGCVVLSNAAFAAAVVETLRSSEAPAKPAASVGTSEDAPAQSTAVPEPSAPSSSDTPSSAAPSFDLSIEYERPDTGALRSAIDALKARLDGGEDDAEALLSDYAAIMADFTHLASESAAAYVLYARDVTSDFYEKEYSDLIAAEYELDVPLTELSVKMYESPVTGKQMESAYPASHKELTYLGRKLNSEAIQPLLREENDLTAEYDELLVTLTVTDDSGKQYTFSEIEEVEDDTQFERLLRGYYAALNEKAGALFLKQLALRAGIADSLGMDSYSDYIYTLYLRDYSPEGVIPLRNAVKKTLVPLYRRVVLSFLYAGGYDALDTVHPDKTAFRAALKNALNEISPEASEAFSYLTENGLIDDDTDRNRMDSCFTLYLYDIGSPFIFCDWNGTDGSATALTHELGHFTRDRICTPLAWNSPESLDLSEIDSQGLELLLLNRYDDFFGDEADAVLKSELISALYSILSGCMEDEFQQEIYADPAMTLPEINALYSRLLREYGFMDLYDSSGTEWVQIPHTFQSPLYYISYAVSMIPALELWSVSRNDPARAYEIYGEMLRRPADASLRELCAAYGLGDPLSPETVDRIADAVEAVF